MASKTYRYFTLMRPPMPGGVPSGFMNFNDFGQREYVPAIERLAWGWVEYDHPLDEEQTSMYELAHDELEHAPKAAIFHNGEIIGYCRITHEVAERLNLIQTRCWFGIKHDPAGGYDLNGQS